MKLVDDYDDDDDDDDDELTCNGRGIYFNVVVSGLTCSRL